MTEELKKQSTGGEPFFVWMLRLKEGRCPGGRPSVSENFVATPSRPKINQGEPVARSGQ